MIENPAACRKPPQNYFAHTEFGRLSYSLGRIDAIDLAAMSDDGLMRSGLIAKELVMAARATSNQSNIDSAMQTFASIQREEDLRAIRQKQY